jgi:4-carboxymuconolactone decarboxylase
MSLRCALVVLMGVAAAVVPGFSRAFAQSSVSSFRIAPVADGDLTPQHRSLVASYVRGGVLTNDIRTLLRHPDSLPGVMPFWNYIAFESTLPAHDRVVLMLRTAWLSRSGYLWAKYAAGARALLNPADLRRITSAATMPEDSFDVALLRAADGLHRQSFIDDGTWMTLDARYSTEQLMDAVFTVAETTMLAGLVNSLAVPIDDEFTVASPGWALRGNLVRTHPTLNAPRVPPLEQTFWTGDLRALLDPDATGRPIAAIYRTLAQHPALYRPRQQLSEYIRTKATLPPRIRELAILRIGALCGSDYEWGAHVPAGRAAGLTVDEIRRIATTPLTSTTPAITIRGWNDRDAAIIRAVDELFVTDVISETVWTALGASLDRRQRIDLLITTGGYRMVSMALNTLGVPLEQNSERLPR